MLRQNELVNQQDRKQNLLCLQVRPSRIQGVGLFSGVHLAAGTILFEIKGERVIHPRYDPYLADKNPNWMGIGYCEWIIMEKDHGGLYINHSCEPNVIVNDKLQVVTFKPVKANDELVMDYSTTELDPDWEMKCNCRENSCRKVLRSFQFLPQPIQEKYAGFIAPVFSEMANRVVHKKSHIN